MSTRIYECLRFVSIAMLTVHACKQARAEESIASILLRVDWDCSTTRFGGDCAGP
jgi:biotin synthase-related radical SAM superfamily protein